MNTSKEEISIKIKNFIFKVLKKHIKDDEDIFLLASKNSLFAFQFILFLERTFGLEISPEDFDGKIFANIDVLSEYVLLKMNND